MPRNDVRAHLRIGKHVQGGLRPRDVHSELRGECHVRDRLQCIDLQRAVRRALHDRVQLGRLHVHGSGLSLIGSYP
jgi:hypothetical protein